MNFTVTIKESVRRRLGRLLPRAVENAIAAIAREAQTQIKMSLTNRELKVRTGTLRGSWGGAPHLTGRGLERRATLSSSGVPYAAIHEFGGVIVPKRARHLWIPLDALHTGAGVSRGTPRQVMQDPGAFGFPKGTFIRGRTVFGKRSKDEVTPIFALKDQVRIPARRYITKSLARVAAKADALVNRAIINAIREGAE